MLDLKPTHTIITDYYREIAQFERIGERHEGAVRSPFQYLLRACARKLKWTLVPEHSIFIHPGKPIRVDGALMDDFRLTHGYWEAKDMDDDLAAAVRSKFEDGYPRDNILFQNPERAILWQNDREVLDVDLIDPPPTDRGSRNVLCPPAGGIRRMGGSSRKVQRPSARAWQGLGRTAPRGAKDEPRVCYRLCCLLHDML